MTPVQDARSVSSAARALARALDGRGTDVATALDRLELHARHVVEDTDRGFAAEDSPSQESLLQEALIQLEVGATLCAAEQARTGSTADLTSAAARLDQAADTIEGVDGSPDGLRGFDAEAFTGSGTDAALLALDEMAAAAGQVAGKVLGKTFKPLLDKVPEELRDLLGELAEPEGLLRWAMRAVRKGIELLTRLVDLPVLETARQRVDEVLARLGRGEDAAVVAGSAIGADAVRARLRELGPAPDSAALAGGTGQAADSPTRVGETGQAADTATHADDRGPAPDGSTHIRALRPGAGHAILAGGTGPAQDSATLVRELAEVADRYSRLCTLLGRVAVAVTGLAAVLAVFQITLAHAAAITTAGLAIVLGVLVVLGRDHTGANDLPGGVRGVGVLMRDWRRAAT
jgi:hypothetical protein